MKNKYFHYILIFFFSFSISYYIFGVKNIQLFSTSRESILEYMEENKLSCRDNKLIWSNFEKDSDIQGYAIKTYNK